jgi:hypothetical protein
MSAEQDERPETQRSDEGSLKAKRKKNSLVDIVEVRRLLRCHRQPSESNSRALPAALHDLSDRRNAGVIETFLPSGHYGPMGRLSVKEKTERGERSLQ